MGYLSKLNGWQRLWIAVSIFMLIPTLLMGTSIMTLAINVQDYSGYLQIMGAMLAVGVPGLCILTVEAILLRYE